MKYYSTLFLALFAIQLSYAQNSNIPEAKGGAYEIERTACLSSSERAIMFDMVQENINNLGLSNAAQISSSMLTSFGFPLRKANGLDWNNYYGISGFFDHDTGFGINDYNCSNRTYDGHKGVDLFTWPFGWYIAENDLVEVIAAAAGTIVGKLDGSDHNNCNFENETWNAVYVLHSDGSMAWYGHMKKNSLTEKGIGDTVTKGEYLGVVASSGYSSGPHLHFEIFEDSNDDTSGIDPYQGNCNNSNGESWWDEQEPYRESQLNVILTHDAEPIPWICPLEEEEANLSNQFNEGATVYFGAYYKDQLIGQSSSYSIKTPDGSIWNSWNVTNTENYNASYWYWDWIMPIGGPFGTWTWETTYEGETQIHSFEYGTNVGIDIIEHQNLLVQPNPFSNSIRVSSENSLDLSSATIELVAMDGKIIPLQISNSNSQNITLDVSNNISSGVYLLKINTDYGIIVRKIIRE